MSQTSMETHNYNQVPARFADEGRRETNSTNMSATKKLLPENKLNYLDQNILQYLFKNPKLSDICFIVNGKRFAANRCVMSAVSDVFAAMLFGTFQESTRADIKISDVVHTESFSILLGYIYGFGIQVDSLKIEVVLEILKLGHCYRLPKLCEALQAYVSNLDLEITSQYCFGTNAFMELLNYAFIYEIVELYDRMKIVIKSSPGNVSKFLDHPKLVDIKCPILIEIFETDNFCSEEVKILGAVLKWIDANVTWTDGDSAARKDKNSGVKNIKLPSFNRLLLNKDSDQQDCRETTSKKPSDIERLLRTVRSARMTLPDVSMFWKKNPCLCTKYEDIMAPIIYNSDHVNYNPRKPYCGTRIQLQCDKYLKTSTDQNSTQCLSCGYSPNQLSANYGNLIYCVHCGNSTNQPTVHFGTSTHQNSTYHSSSSDITTCKNLNIKLGVHRYTNKEMHAYLTHVNKVANGKNPTDSLDCVSYSYSLRLRSFNPFKDSLIVEKKNGEFKLSDRYKICSHLSSFPSQNQGICGRYGYNKACTSGPPSCTPEYVLIESKMSEAIFNQSEFIKNTSFKLEAFVEFTD